MLAEAKLLHDLKARSPMLKAESGAVTDVKLLPCLNAWFPMLVTESSKHRQ